MFAIPRGLEGRFETAGWPDRGFSPQTCSTQIKTLSMGREPHFLDPQKVARFQDQMSASDHYNYNGETEWPGLIRMLDKREPDYAS